MFRAQCEPSNKSKFTLQTNGPPSTKVMYVISLGRALRWEKTRTVLVWWIII